MRYQDWPERLAAFISSKYNEPFAWGAHDCCAFAAAVVLELTGDDHFAPFAGYSTALEAARVLKQHGGVPGIATAALGEQIPLLTAGRGDIVMITTEHGDALAVCLGDRCVAPGIDSLQYLPMTAAVAAWRVV
jgi:hypothetical protein